MKTSKVFSRSAQHISASFAASSIRACQDADGRWKRAEISARSRGKNERADRHGLICYLRPRASQAYAKGEFSFDLPAENLVPSSGCPAESHRRVCASAAFCTKTERETETMCQWQFSRSLQDRIMRQICGQSEEGVEIPKPTLGTWFLGGTT